MMNKTWISLLAILAFVAYIPVFLQPYGPANNISRISEVPIWHWAILVVGLVFWLWMMQDAFIRGKFLWLIGIFIFFVLGAVVYWFIFREKVRETTPQS